jgi:hypothetical protein
VIDLSRATSVTCRRVPTGQIVYESNRPVVLSLLARRLRLKRPTGAICMCPGTLVFEIQGGESSRITLHHGETVRWPGSPGNVELLDPDAMMDFLADHGMPFVRDEHLAGLARRAHDVAEAERWHAVTPRALQRFRDAMVMPRADSVREWASLATATQTDVDLMHERAQPTAFRVACRHASRYLSHGRRSMRDGPAQRRVGSTCIVGRKLARLRCVGGRGEQVLRLIRRRERVHIRARG